MNKTIKEIEAKIKEVKNECWSYNKEMLRENNYKKSDIGCIETDSTGWEDVIYFEGLLYGLEIAKGIIENK